VNSLARAAAVFAVLAVLPLGAQEALRGEVRLDLEPVYGFFTDEVPEGMVRLEAAQPPLAFEEAKSRAAREAAMLYGAMIYGWSFHYDIGEKARGFPEDLQLEPQGTVLSGDPRLEITDVHIRDMRLYLWSDYRPGVAQKNRLSMWKAGTTRSAQAAGRGPLGDTARPRSDGADENDEDPAWLAVKRAALEDAARAAIRAMLRASERNRPREAEGYISLAAFPRFFLDKGQWTVTARFYVNITELHPFAAH
jgi:hypothetical protein